MIKILRKLRAILPKPVGDRIARFVKAGLGKKLHAEDRNASLAEQAPIQSSSNTQISEIPTEPSERIKHFVVKA